MSKYGDEVIELVLDYCRENNLTPKEILKKKRERKRKENSISKSENKEWESFFNPPLHNNLSEQSKQSLKKEISQLPFLRPDSEITNPYIIEQRKIFKRAYEPWSEKEEIMIINTIKQTNDIDFLSELFQRNPGSLRSFLKKKFNS